MRLFLPGVQESHLIAQGFLVVSTFICGNSWNAGIFKLFLHLKKIYIILRYIFIALRYISMRGNGWQVDADRILLTLLTNVNNHESMFLPSLFLWSFGYIVAQYYRCCIPSFTHTYVLITYTASVSRKRELALAYFTQLQKQPDDIHNCSWEPGVTASKTWLFLCLHLAYRSMNKKGTGSLDSLLNSVTKPLLHLSKSLN